MIKELGRLVSGMAVGIALLGLFAVLLVPRMADTQTGAVWGIYGDNATAANSGRKMAVLPCKATAAPPGWTEGRLVPCSTDLAGAMRAYITNGGNTDANLNAEATLVATPTTTYSATECAIVSAASTNATSCKASGGNVYGWDLYNTTTTVYYLRLYNLATAPTPSSATGFVRSIPIPPALAAGQVGGVVRVITMGVGYSTGVGYAITGGSSSTDNTNAAVGVFGAVLYK